MKINEANLPNGWAKATIGMLADYVNGRAFKPTEWKDVGKPIIRIQNLNNNNAKYNFSPENHEEKYLVKNGDLLFAWSASLGAYIWHGEDAWLNQHIFIVHPKNCTTKLFVFYLLEKITTELYAKAHGSGMVHVTKGKFESTEISLPPLNEQHRIIAKIEELFSELDKGIENLKIAQSQLKVYRQALLKHAFEGKLTAQWRAERNVIPAKAGIQPLNDMDSRLPPAFARVTGNDEVGGGNDKPLETAEALLKRIQQERMQRYQQQLADWEKSPSIPLLQRGKPTSAAPIPSLEKGGRGGISKPKPPKSLPPLTAEELAELPELPEGWAWTRLGNTNVDVSDGPFGSNLKSSDYVDVGVRVIRLENIGALEFIEDKESFITEAKYELLKNHTVKSGDIIFSSFITENVRVAMLPASIQRAVNKADCFCVRLYGKTLSNAFAVMFLSTRHVFKQLEAQIHGVGRPRINTTQLKAVAIPICGIEEQQVIISLVEARLSEVDQLDQTITTALQQAEALRQSILKKAFSGQLVPQDPNDEPASELLARIRAEKVVQPNNKKGRL